MSNDRGKMVAMKMMSKLGDWLFLLGVLLAIVLGLIWPSSGPIAALLALIGLVVGLLNITAGEVRDFLLASVALIVAASGFSLIPLIGGMLANILGYIVALVAPAAVVVALIAIWKLAKSKSSCSTAIKSVVFPSWAKSMTWANRPVD